MITYIITEKALISMLATAADVGVQFAQGGELRVRDSANPADLEISKDMLGAAELMLGEFIANDGLNIKQFNPN